MDKLEFQAIIFHICGSSNGGEVSNLLSGFLGAALGGLITLLVAIYQSRQANTIMERQFIDAKKSMTRERYETVVSNAIIQLSQIRSTYRNYDGTNGIRHRAEVQLTEDFRSQIANALQAFESAKRITALLPKELRNRWDSVLILVADFRNLKSIESSDILMNRAGQDVDHYIDYVFKSLSEYMDERKISPDLEHPYLKRDDLEIDWDEANAAIRTKKI